ncbi:MAG: hypothetical protein NTX46_00405 [Chloroflexi bacterium]|nr:hypothetical protein [Chloroflexota bacterium]
MPKRDVVKLEFDGAVASDGRRQTGYQYGDVCAAGLGGLRLETDVCLGAGTANSFSAEARKFLKKK